MSIDAAVTGVMVRDPNEPHALVLCVSPSRLPLDLSELLPCPEDLNTCTRLWREWEKLVERQDAGEEVVITGVWHREMLAESLIKTDIAGRRSPANLDLILEAKVHPNGTRWSVVDSTIGAYNGGDGNPEDNVRQVRAWQGTNGNTQYEFRVRVEHNPTNDSGYTGSQAFTLASRHAFQQ